MLLIFLIKLLTHFKTKPFEFAADRASFSEWPIWFLGIILWNLLVHLVSVKQIRVNDVQGLLPQLMMYNADSVNNSTYHHIAGNNIIKSYQILAKIIVGSSYQRFLSPSLSLSLSLSRNQRLFNSSNNRNSSEIMSIQINMAFFFFWKQNQYGINTF